MRKVLLVSGGDIERGGVQNFLVQWIKMASQSDLEFVWYCLGKVTDVSYANNLKQFHVRIIAGNHREKSNIKRYFCLSSDLYSIFKNEYFDIIHVNTGGINVQTIAICVANYYKIPIRISHSHGCVYTNNLGVKLICSIEQRFLRQKATCCAGCSTEAGTSLFGKKVLYSPKWRLIKNTIDIKKYIFNEQVRRDFRNKIVDSSYLVMGCVGALNENKNQKLALHIVKELKRRGLDKVKLLLIGSGVLEEHLKEEANTLDIADNVCFLGVSSCVENWLQAMDIFLMPSLSEGLPISALEAQAAGLPCILSDRISRETQIIDFVSFQPIEDLKAWIEIILKIVNELKDYDRNNVSTLACNSDIDVKRTIQDIGFLYKIELPNI